MITAMLMFVMLGLVSPAGRLERRAMAEARQKRPDLQRFYGRDLEPVRPGAFEFRLRLLRGGAAPLDLTPVTEAFFWEDAEAVLTGGLELRRPDPEDASSIPIGVGHRVSCDVRWQGSWYRLWQMRVQPHSVDVGEGSLTVDLRDDLVLLGRERRDWSFRKTKTRKRGWFCHEIAMEVAKREGLKVGVIAKGKYRLDRLVRKNASGLDVLRAAYGHERRKSGRRFVIRMRNGLLDVIALQRNLILYEFKEQVEAAQVAQERAIRPVTVLEGRGRVGRGKGARRVRHTEARRAVIDRFGRTVEKKDYGRVDSLADLRDKVLRDYAKKLRVKRTASLTVPGVPFLRRGDSCRWVTKEEGWYGSTTELRDRSFVYVRQVRHSVTGGEYTTSMEVVQEDPYVKDAARQDREARERARAK